MRFMDPTMRASAKLILLAVVGLAILIAGAWLFLDWMFGGDTLSVIEKKSPDRRHSARLVTREGGFDVNLVLEVDGTLVYTSPDFAAPAKADFQERLIWDRSGRIVVVEVAGERLFAFDVSRRRPLSARELLQIEFSTFDDLTFTDTLPRETLSVTRP
jgi:hypothetical protein